MERWQFVSANDVENVKIKLTSGEFDANSCDEQGASALYVACKNGSSELTKLLLTHGARAGSEPLIVASENGHLECVRLLLTNRADIVNCRNQNGQTPMHLAIEAGRMEIVKVLVDAGCDVNTPDRYGMTVLLKAASACQLSALKELMDLGAAVDSKSIDDETALHLLLAGYIDEKAEVTGHSRYGNASMKSIPDDSEILDAVNFLLKNGADCNALNSDGDTSLSIACEAGMDKIVAVLLESGCDVNAVGGNPCPLLIACSKSNEVIVEQLLIAGACVNGPRDQGVNKWSRFMPTQQHPRLKISRMTPLIVGIKSLSPRIVETLIKHGADVNLKGRFGKGKRPVDYAVDYLLWYEPIKDRSSHFDQLKEILRLLLQSNAEISTAPNSESFLHRICSRGLLDVAKMLLEHGVDPNEMCISSGVRSTPLRAACVSGNEGLVKLLLFHGALLTEPAANARNQSGRCDRYYDGEPLLHVASANSHANLAALLLKLGASVNSVDSRRRTALYLAADAAVAKVLLERGDADVNFQSESRKTPLYKACRNERADVVALLLKNGADVNGNIVANPLRAACSRGNTDIVKLLLSYNAKCDETEEEFGSLLCRACEVGSDVMVEELIRHGASTNAVDCREKPPLFVALEERALFETSDARSEGPAGWLENNMKIIDALLANGADPNVTGSDRETPFLFAVEHGMHDVVDKLIDHGADVDLLSAGRYPITAVLNCIGDSCQENENKSDSTSARQQCFVQTLTLLLRRRVNFNVLNDKGESPLYTALLNGLLEAAKVMIKTGADANLTGRKHYPLIFACSKGLRDVAESLLDAGADPDVTDWFGKTPLCTAAENFDELTTSLLLSWKANPNAVDRNRDAPLHRLMKSDVQPPVLNNGTYSNLVDLLLKSGARVNAVNDWGETALYLACVKMNEDLQLIEMLLNRGADANIQLESSKRRTGSDFGDYEDGRLPLFVAVSRANQKLFKLLIDHGADINQTDDRGMSVVHRAVSYPGIGTASCREIESMLLFVLSFGAGVDVVDEYGKTALYYAACETRYRADDGIAVKVAGILLNHGADVNRTAVEHARIPLAAACWTQNTDLAKLFLSKGAKTNVSIVSGTALVFFNDPYTPLCIAVYKGNHTLASLLLQNGADVNLQDIGGQTALHIAVNRVRRCNDGTDDCMRLLLHHGADFNVADDKEETPLYQACCRELPKTVTMMLEYRKLTNHDTLHRPLLAAVRCENESLVEQLLAHGADPDFAARDPVCYKPMDKGISSPLCVAADVGNVSIVRRLLAAGASTNVADSSGRTAIHYVLERYSVSYEAARVRHSVRHWRRYDTVADLLLDAGSDLSRVDPKSESRPLKVVISTLVDDLNIFIPSVTSRRAIFRMFDKLFAYGAVIEEPAVCGLSGRGYEERGVYTGLGEFMHIQDIDFKWIVKLFKAGVPNHLLVKCSLGMPDGDPHTNCTALAQAVVLNKARLDPSVDTIELRWQTNVFEHRQFELWCEEDRRQPPRLMRLCRVVVRKQLFVASGGRTILPSIKRLPLPLQVLQYLAFEGVHSEVDLTLSDDSDDDAFSSSNESWEDAYGGECVDSYSSDDDDDENSDEAMSPDTDDDWDDDDDDDDDDESSNN